MERINRDNQVLAEFMGVGHLTPLPYHDSWDALIPVIEKFALNLNTFNRDEADRHMKNIQKRLTQLDLLATYGNLVDAVNWFNWEMNRFEDVCVKYIK
jgi:hypothetical protein